MSDTREIQRASLEEVVRQIPAAVIVVEAPSGKIIFRNRRAQEIRERSSSRARGTGLEDAAGFEILHPDGRPYEVEEWPLMRSIRGGEEVRDEEILYPLADGSRLWLRCNSSPIYDEEGRIVAGVLVGDDVTERKRAEEELHRSEERFRSLVQNTSDIITVVDAEGTISYISPAVERVLGYRPEETIGKDIVDEVHPDDVVWVKNKLTALLKGAEEPSSMWYHIRDKEGAWHYFEAVLTNLRDDPSVKGIVINQRDVSERKKGEEELRKSEDRFRATFEQVAVGISHTASDGRLLRVNRKLCDILGYTREELLEMTVQERTHPEDLDKDLEQARQLLAGEIEPYSIEKRLFREDDSVVWVNLTVSRVREPSGELGYSITVIEDITERKRVEEALEEANRRAESILESITDAFCAVDRHWRFTYVNERTLHIFGELKSKEFTREEVLGQSVWEAFPNIVGTLAEEKYRQAMADQESSVFEYHYPGEGVEGEQRPWFEIHLYPSEGGLSVYYQDITERKRAEREIETRTHQQAVVAELGLWALANENLQSLMDDTLAFVAQTLNVEYCKIAELLPDGDELVMRWGAGWKEGSVGVATERAGVESQAGYTLRSEESVVVEDLGLETRFEASPLVREHGAVSGMSVVIPGRGGPFGVLGAYTRSHRIFSEDDVNFLQAVANVIAMRIGREEADRELRGVRDVERSRLARDLHDEALQDLAYASAQARLARTAPDEAQTADRTGRIVAALKRVERQLHGAIYDLRLETEQDKPFHELLKQLVELHRGMTQECAIHLETGDGVLAGPLGDMGREILRILGEALANARRHSSARNIWVAVRTSESHLLAEISDDGQGFDPAQEPATTTTGGIGIRGMRERARSLGADLKIESEPGEGTKVRLEMPLQKEREEPEENVRVILVEDHATVREAIASTFERGTGFEVVAQAGSLREAREVLEVQPVDVAVIDLGLPDGYGGDLIKELRAANPRAQALVLSATLDRSEIARAVEAGATGVLHKSAHLDRVVDAVRRLKAGETLLPLQEIVDLLRFSGQQREQVYEARKAIARLTPRERDVLQALAEGFDSRQIAERLHISLRTERNHMASILSKLEVHSQLQALVFALRHGVVDLP